MSTYQPYEEIVAPATSLASLRAGEPCMIVRDAAGQMFVREVVDEDVLRLL